MMISDNSREKAAYASKFKLKFFAKSTNSTSTLLLIGLIFANKSINQH